MWAAAWRSNPVREGRREGVQWSGRGRVVARKESGKPAGTESKRAKDRDRETERDLPELPTKCRGGQLGKEVLLSIYGGCERRRERRRERRDLERECSGSGGTQTRRSS